MQTATVTWVGEQKFLATSPSGHAIVLDSESQSNKAPTPMELLLMALGACTATDVVIILEKKRQKLQGLEVICSGERAAAPPGSGPNSSCSIAFVANWTTPPLSVPSS
jgi:putative redox protein